METYVPNRKGEDGTVPFRSGRFYCVGSDWYFAVRRGADHGPYKNKSEARKALTNFLNDQLAFESHLKSNRGGFSLLAR